MLNYKKVSRYSNNNRKTPAKFNIIFIFKFYKN